MFAPRTSLQPWFNEEEGTVFAEYLVLDPSASGDSTYHRVVEVNDGTGDNRHIPRTSYSAHALRTDATFVR